MITIDRLKVFYSKDNRHIIAHVFDGNQKFDFRFGRNCSIKLINEQIPKLVADSYFDQRLKERYYAKKERKTAAV